MTDVLAAVMAAALIIAGIGGLIGALWVTTVIVYDWWTRRRPHGRYAANRTGQFIFPRQQPDGNPTDATAHLLLDLEDMWRRS